MGPSVTGQCMNISVYQFCKAMSRGHPPSLPQQEIASLSAQLEDLDRKHSSADRQVRGLKEQLEEAQERLSEETRAKITISNKQKQLSDEVERLNQQLEDEEEAKTAVQNKLMQITQQVCLVISPWQHKQHVSSS